MAGRVLELRSCDFCDARAQYRERRSGLFLCLEHARLEVVAPEQRAVRAPLVLRPATPTDAAAIEALCLHFWDETRVDCFGRQYDVLACPATLACEGKRPVGLAAYAVEKDLDALILVILNVLPEVQGQGTGRALLDVVRDEARAQNVRRILVVTSNDDLPALSLYQRYGFRIARVIPGRIAEHHGGEVGGFAGIPVRDEVQLAFELQVT